MPYEIRTVYHRLKQTVLDDRMYHVDFACASFEKNIDGNPRDKFHTVISTMKIKN